MIQQLEKTHKKETKRNKNGGKKDRKALPVSNRKHSHNSRDFRGLTRQTCSILCLSVIVTIAEISSLALNWAEMDTPDLSFKSMEKEEGIGGAFEFGKWSAFKCGLRRMRPLNLDTPLILFLKYGTETSVSEITTKGSHLCQIIAQ